MEEFKNAAEIKKELTKLKCKIHGKSPSIKISTGKPTATVCCEEFGLMVVEKAFEIKKAVSDADLKKRFDTFSIVYGRYIHGD
jgi:hypothetical protein